MPPTTRFDAIGVPWTIQASEPLEPALVQRVRARIEEYDSVYSRFRPDSLVSRIASGGQTGPAVFPDDATTLFDLYDRLHRLTDGAVDPLVGHQLELLGYDPDYNLTPAPAHLRGAAHTHRPVWGRDGHHHGPELTLTRPALLDVGAAGKGHLVDIVTDLLTNAGVADVVVDASGDLRHHGNRPTRVGLEHPHRTGHVVGVIDLRDQALCASATSRRTWGPGLHHVLDARTGTSTHDVVATWVVAETAAVADGLATALFFTEPDQLAAAFDFQYVRLNVTGRLDASGHLNGEVFAPATHRTLVNHTRSHP